MASEQNGEKIGSKDSSKVTLKESILFLFCAVPGLIVFVYSLAIIPYKIFFPFTSVTPKWVLSLCLPGMLIGWFMMLVGTGKIKSMASFKKNLLRGLLFILFAIPGVWAFTFSLIIFTGVIFVELGFELTVGQFLILTLSLVIGWMFVLLGTDRLRKWRHGFTLLSLPMIGLLSLAARHILGKGIVRYLPFGFLVLLALSVYMVEKALIHYYEKKKEIESPEESDAVHIESPGI